LITAMRLRQICSLNPNEVILYGYTFARETLFVFIDNDDNLVRVTEDHNGNVLRYETSRNVHPSFWSQNVKRWYRDDTNDNVRELCASFMEYGLPETNGGGRWKGKDCGCEPPTNKRIVFNLDEHKHLD